MTLNVLTRYVRRIFCCASAGMLLVANPAGAAADKILVNGKIITVDDQFSIATAVAVSGTQIAAVGSDTDIRATAGSGTEIVDLGGRTVIPGLIDSHLHVIRGSEHWTHEARFDAVVSRGEALTRVKSVVARVKPGEWVFSLGGWYEEQFRDDPRGFSRTELDALAPSNPVFLQAEYERAYVNSAYLKAMGFPLKADKKYVAAAKGLAADVVRDADGTATGLLSGGFWMVARAIARFPAVTRAEQDAGVRALTADLNRLGLTAAFDPGGLGVQSQSYQRFRESASRGELTTRVFYTLGPDLARSGEAQLRSALDALDSTLPYQGDDYFDLLAFGEVYYRDFHFDSQVDFVNPSAQDIDAARRILTLAAKKGWSVETHASHPATMNNLFDLMDEINTQYPLRQLRWSITHADRIDAESLRRARSLGMNIQLRSSPVIGGMDPEIALFGAEAYAMPPLRLVQDSGVTFGLSTDGTKASQINPFVALWWATTGKKLDGKVITRQPLTRQEALIAYTRSNAAMLFQENRIGAIKPGLLADLVVLDRDYLTVPVDEIAAIKPVATMVGGAFVFNTALRAQTSPHPGVTWPTADLVLYDGKIITVDDQFRVAQALAVKYGRIIFVGADSEVKRYLGKDTRVIDLRGELAIPGLIDIHAHPLDIGRSTVDGGSGTQHADEWYKQRYRNAQQAGYEVGLTGWHDVGVSPQGIEIYKQMADGGELKMRVHAMLREPRYDNPQQLADYFRKIRAINYGGHHVLQVRAIEADVSSVDDKPGTPATAQHLRDLLTVGLETGMQIAFEAGTSRANDASLDALGAALKAQPAVDHRTRIDQDGAVASEDLKREVQLGVIAPSQPGGAVDPLRGFYSGVMGQRTGRTPVGGQGVPKRLSREAALRSYTIEAARAAFMEDDTGSLEVGKLADIVVLDHDIMTVEASRIPDTKVRYTILGGEFVYRAH